jgi:hypothetical protein
LLFVQRLAQKAGLRATKAIPGRSKPSRNGWNGRLNHLKLARLATIAQSKADSMSLGNSVENRHPARSVKFSKVITLENKDWVSLT